MDLFANLATGFGAAVTPVNLGFCLFGCLIGTLIGVLPGIGPIATIAMLLPVTFGLSPLGALIMLAGIYYGAQYGGSTTAILVNLPGESSSVVTCIDGYQMAQKGRAGAALAIAAVGSLFAGCVGTILIAAFAPVLAAFAVKFRSPEYFALMLFGLIAAVILAHGSVVKAVGMVILGLLVGLVGTELQSATARFTFGVPELYDGVDFVPLAMGLFGLAEILSNLDRRRDPRAAATVISSLWPSRAEIRRAVPAVVRGTMIGALLGILPGGGAVLASFAAYTLEKKTSRFPAEFGKGAVEGVAAPEAANNAGAQTSFIPLLTLGIPSNPVMALMMGAMLIQGIAPGTAIITDRPELFWGMVASMWVGNLMLIIINLPLIGHLGAPAAGAVPAAVPVHRGAVLRRRLQRQFQHLPHPHDGRFRLARLRLRQARLRRGAVPARLRARSADGGELPPLHGAVVRRSHDLLAPPDLAVHPARGTGADRADHHSAISQPA